MSKQLTLILALTAVAFVSCGPSKTSKNQEAAKKREASLAETKRVEAGFGDLQIAINAGVSQEEFSQRTNDALIKIGDLQRSESLAESGFPGAKEKVGGTYLQFLNAAEAYKLSKRFFGPNPVPLYDGDEDRLSAGEYKMLQGIFPDAYEHGGYFSSGSRKDTLQGLWKIAQEDTDAADVLIDQLSTPAS